jgi:uncharacterized protein YacL
VKNKYFCVAITFWQYVWMGVKDVFTDKEAQSKSFQSRMISSVFGVLIGLALGSLMAFAIKFFNIFDIFAKCVVGFFIFVCVVDLICAIIFLFISWRKAVNDCWDKFHAG